MSTEPELVSNLNLGIVNRCTLFQDPEAESILICNSCKDSLNARKVPKFSLHNMGHLGSEQPPCLKALSLSEKILLSPGRAFITLKRLRFGSFASSGNSIALAQDVDNIATRLPLSLNALPEHLTIVLVDTKHVPAYSPNLNRDILKKHCPNLIVRRSVWLAAFNYLKVHSPVFANISLDANALQRLPDNDIPEEVVQALQVSSNEVLLRQDLGHVQQTEEIEVAAEEDDEVSRPIQTSTARNTAHNLSPYAQLEAAFRPKIVVETRLGDPISEFTDGDYFHKCFPDLFYNGKGDFCVNRPVKLTLREWFVHKLRYMDTRFATNVHFIAVVNNMISRHENISRSRTMLQGKRLSDSVQQSISDVLAGDFLVLNPLSDEVISSTEAGVARRRATAAQKEVVKEVLKSVYTVTQHQPGSRADKHRSRRQIMTMIREHNGVDLFFTLSSAEMHWPEVQRLIYQRKVIAETGRLPEDYQSLHAYSYKTRLDNCATYPVEVVYHFKYFFLFYFVSILFQM